MTVRRLHVAFMKLQLLSSLGDSGVAVSCRCCPRREQLAGKTIPAALFLPLIAAVTEMQLRDFSLVLKTKVKTFCQHPINYDSIKASWKSFSKAEHVNKAADTCVRLLMQRAAAAT